MVITVDSHLVNNGTIDSITEASPADTIRALQYAVGVPPTGVYDDLTVAAVSNFQIRVNLPTTGEVDKDTFDALFPPMAHPEPTTIFTIPNVTVTGNLDDDDDKTIKLCQTMLNYIPTGYLDEDTRSALSDRGYDLDTASGITDLQEDLNSAILKEVSN